MSPRKESSPSLNRLLDELVNDLTSLTDEELRAEAEADGVDLEAEAERVRSCIAFAIAREGKKQLHAARTAVDKETKARVLRPMRVRNRSEVLARFAEHDGKLKSRLTMAARNGSGISDVEADSILEDLRELGVIDDEGNPI